MEIIFLGRFNNSEILNGPEKVAKRLFNQLALNNIKVTFIEHFFNSGQKRFLNRWLGYKVIKTNPKVLRLGILRLFWYLIFQQPEIIHIISAERFIIPLFYYKFLLKSKIITTLHSILKEEIPPERISKKGNHIGRDFLLENLIIKNSQKLVFLSQIQLNLAKKYYHIRNKNVSMIPNGIDEEFFSERKFPEINNFLNIVFYNGTGDKIDRGLKFVLEELNNVEEKIKLFIIGSDTTGQLDKVHFEVEVVKPMSLTELIEFLKDKHFILKSITYDTFPLIVAESMAAGLIPVISDKVGLVSLIRHGENGFIYDNRIIALSSLLNHIFSGAYNLRNISQNAKDSVRQLRWTKIASMYLELYKQVLDEKF